MLNLSRNARVVRQCARGFSASAVNAQKKSAVGFIGLGNMGGHMAANLAKHGHPLVVFDVNTAAVGRLQQLPDVRGAATPSEVASQVDVVITMLPSSPHVQSVYSAANGVFAGLRRGSLLIDTSTIDPTAARTVAAAAVSHGAAMIDAPVSGGVGGAEAGTLTFMVGGDAESFDRAKPLLQCMGKNIVHCGSAGNGQVVKVCNNLVLGISMIGVSEAMNLGISLGMDAKTLAGIFNTSSARCWSSDTYNPVPGVLPNVPASRGYAGGFGVDLMAKDLGLAVNAAEQIKAPLPLAAVALQLYNLLSAHGYGGKDFGSIYEFLKKQEKKSSS
eukprot:TRINITY_DN931_c0_g2_i1.p1 TRINITY_DN931_c0_g2~~TRINITY_DN931_c0_g2_i1.p1  ORF type:complete len:330 (-),score=111.71 TRINITY_DN931_c0_g2_i1:143-1132(-)